MQNNMWLLYVCQKLLKLQAGTKYYWKMDCFLWVCLKSPRPFKLTLLKALCYVIGILLP